MRISSKTPFHALSTLVLVALVAVAVGHQLYSREPGASLKDLAFSEGARVYAIAQAADAWPKIREATVDPKDVHVGNTQVIEALIQSREPVSEVFARITTDNETRDLPLQLVGTEGEGDEQLGRYRASWVVRDVHNTTYEMLIVARAGADESSVTLNWSDACGIPAGGAASIIDPCTISSPDGVEEGDAAIYTTLTLDASFAFNPGYSLTIESGGSIAICDGCEIKESYIYLIDEDGDGYPDNYDMVIADNPPSDQYFRRSALPETVDCDPTDKAVWEGCDEGGGR